MQRCGRPSTCGPGAAGAATGNEELLRLVKEAKDGGNAWVVAKFDALTAGGRVPNDMMQRLPAINWVTVTGHVNGGVRAAVRAETRDEAAAKNLRDVLQGILGLAKMQTGQRADLAAVIDSIELGGEGKNVSLALSVPIEAIDQLAAPGDAARTRTVERGSGRPRGGAGSGSLTRRAGPL